MKHLFTKSLMCMLLLLIGMCTNAWAASGSFPEGTRVYFKCDKWKSTGEERFKINLYNVNGGDHIQDMEATQYGETSYYYIDIPAVAAGKAVGGFMICRMNSSYQQWNYSSTMWAGTRSNDLQNCLVNPNSISNNDNFTWDVFVAPEAQYAVTISNGDHGSVAPTGSQQVGATGFNITATPSDGYKFVRWEVSGGAHVASSTDRTTKLTADDAGSVTAIWAEIEYVYFYAGLNNTWDNSKTTLKIGNSSGSVVTPYDNTTLGHDSGTKNATPSQQLYETYAANSHYNSGTAYNVYIYRVPVEQVGQNVYLGHSSWTFDTSIGTIAAGAIYTLTNGDNGGTYMTAPNIAVTSMTSGAAAMRASAATVTGTANVYGSSVSNLYTAGHDKIITTYTLNNITDESSEVIEPNVEESYANGVLSRTITIPEAKLITGKTYTLTMKLADRTTGKISASGTSDEFMITSSTCSVTLEVDGECAGWGTIAPTSIPDVASGISISADGATLTIGTTSVVATAAEQTDEYTYGLANPAWTWIPSGSTITAATTATANFTRTARTYNITYKDGGNVTYSGSNGASLIANYTFGTGVAELVAGVKAGYTFGGWFESSDCTSSAVTSIAASETGDKTLYAKWTKAGGCTPTRYELWSSHPSPGVKIGDFEGSDGTFTINFFLDNDNRNNLFVKGIGEDNCEVRYSGIESHFDNVDTYVTLTESASGTIQFWRADGRTNYKLTLTTNDMKLLAGAGDPEVETVSAAIENDNRTSDVVGLKFVNLSTTASEGYTYEFYELNSSNIDDKKSTLQTGVAVTNTEWQISSNRLFAVGTYYFAVKVVSNSDHTVYKWSQVLTMIVTEPAPISGITIYVKSEKGGVLINSGTKTNNAVETSIDGTSVSTKADCTQETWYYITIEADKITDLFLSATGCSQNTEAFTLNGEGKYYFDCTTSQTTQVTEAEYCKSKEVKIYVYSKNWNGWVPSIYGQWKTATGGYQDVENRYMTTVSCNPTNWYELTYDEENYPGLAYVQIELRLTKSDNTRSHKINNNWTTIAAGTTIYWDITSGCDDNENAPKETDKRPCEGEKTYTVTYNVNGGSGSVSSPSPMVAGYVYTIDNTYLGTKTGYTFGGWNDGSKTYQAGASYTMPKQDVVFTAVWNKNAAGSEWYLAGANMDGGWTNTNATMQFNMVYRGMENVYYQVINYNKFNDWFKLTKNDSHYYSADAGTTNHEYSEIGAANKITITKNDQASGGAMKYTSTSNKNVWAVVDQTNSKFWIEDIPTLYDVTVTNNVGVAEGSTYTLTNGSVGCTQFATGETYTLTVTPKDGYAAIITVDGVPAQDVSVNPTPQDDMTTITTYTYSAKMGSANIHIDITYEKLTPITVKFRIDAPWDKADNYEPMIQWTTTNYTTWSGWPSEYTTRIHKLPGYTDWYYWTFEDSKTILKWQLKNGHVDYDNLEAINHSGVIQVTVYDDNLCYAISETPNPYGQRTPNTTDCPDVNAKLTVNGGDLAGSTAALSSTCDLSTTWVNGYTIQKTYSYTYNGKEYALETAETAEYLVAGAGTYVYKVEIELVRNSDSKVIASGIDTKTVVVAAPELSIEPSTTGAAQNVPVSVKTTLKNVASSEKVIICWSLLDSEGNDQLVSFTDNHDGTYSFTTPSKDGTYTIHAELKVGTECGHATTVAVAEENIKVGSLTAELEVSPDNAKTNDRITLTVRTSNTSGDVHYTYSVKAASNPTTRVLAENSSSNTNNSFTVPSEDEYTFTVVVTDDNGSVTVSKTIKTGVGTLYMKYCWDGTRNEDWNWQEMTYEGDGMYKRYVTTGSNLTKYWDSKTTANTNSKSSDDGSSDHTIVKCGSISNGGVVAYYYDKINNTMYAYGSGVYRLKSVTDYGTFYSNVPKGDGKISFYATASATSKLYLQTMTNGEWETAGESITSITVPKNGIFVADMAANGAVSNLTEYAGTLSAYTGGSARTYEASGTTTNTFTDFRNTTTTYYDHYYMEYHGASDAEYGATVGNDINHCLANVLNSYSVSLECNTRYEYDSRTNKLSRTMIAGSHDPENEPTHYLAVYGENLTKNTSPYAALKKAAPQDLTDCQNWVYSTRIKGEKPAGDSRDINGYIYAKFNSADRWVLASDGLESSTDAYVTILGGSTTTGTYDLLLMYDYKTNRLTAGWCPESEITIDNQQVVDANIIFMRSEQGEVEQIKLGSDDSKVASLQKAIFVQKLEQSTATKGTYYYMFALPFDCKVSDIYGLAGRYLSAWGIQRYAGEERAATGWFKEDGKTFWKWVGVNETLKAGEGYSLCVIRDKQGWYSGGANYLYFPSTEDGFSLTKSKSDQVIEYAPLHCNIDKSKDTNPEDPTRDRRSYDSNWRLIGTLACNNITIKENGAIHTDGDKEDWLWHKDGTGDESNYPSGTAKKAGKVPNFIYAIETDEVGKITGYVPTASNGYDFRSFTSYMVQFEGKINWSQYTEAKPEEAISSVAARRYVSAGNTSTRRETMFDLMLTKENEVADQTFVQLAEEATTGFDYNLDLTKIENSDRAQLWSIAENTNYAGNVLPLNVDTIPLTVVVRENGEYTMTMSKECLEYNPLLWDAYEQTITDLNTMDYSTQLIAGTWANRYYIILGYRAPQTNEENPDDNSGIATSIRENRKSETGITKVMVNGVLYILREGHLYDGIGRRVK